MDTRICIKGGEIMKGQTHYGKGSAQRPTDRDKFDTGWESIFGNKLRGLRSTNNDEVLEQKEVQTVPNKTQPASTKTKA